jgi:hypothetical protein
MKRWHYGLTAISFLLGSLFIYSATALAQYQSTSYSLNEVFIGNGSSLQSTSNSYSAQISIGETGIGNSKGTSYQAQNGFNTSDTPELAVNVTGGVFDLGVLSTGSVSYASTTFTIENYLSSGYIAVIAGSAPTDGPGGHALNSLSTPTVSTPGTEQFGINLVQNTSPAVGAPPQQIPDVSFSFGQVSTNYGQQNKFEFVPNSTIAYSNSSTGETQYTLSVIENISQYTPGGVYGNANGLAGYLDIVAVPTF